MLFRAVIEQSLDDDYIVVALSSEDGLIAEYTHCATAKQAATALFRYHSMPEVQSAFALHRFDISDEHRQLIGELNQRGRKSATT